MTASRKGSLAQLATHTGRPHWMVQTAAIWPQLQNEW